MRTSADSCNGYKNYFTWYVASWIDNHESLYLLVSYWARSLRNEGVRAPERQYKLSRQIKDLMNELLLEYEKTEDSLMHGLILGALEDVDYLEIATNYCEEVDA